MQCSAKCPFISWLYIYNLKVPLCFTHRQLNCFNFILPKSVHCDFNAIFHFVAHKCLFLDLVCSFLCIKYFGMLLKICKQLLGGSCSILQCQTVHTCLIFAFLGNSIAFLQDLIYNQYILLHWYEKLPLVLNFWRVWLHTVDHDIDKCVELRLKLCLWKAFDSDYHMFYSTHAIF